MRCARPKDVAGVSATVAMAQMCYCSVAHKITQDRNKEIRDVSTVMS